MFHEKLQINGLNFKTTAAIPHTYTFSGYSSLLTKATYKNTIEKVEILVDARPIISNVHDQRIYRHLCVTHGYRQVW